MNTRVYFNYCRAAWVLAAAGLLLGMHGGAWAADTDISNVPLFTNQSNAIKPNLLFILDNSGSMSRAYMPDDMDTTGAYGYNSSQCNGVAYNPTLTYSPPVKANGTSYANSSFTSAWSDGYAGTGATNLMGTASSSYTASSLSASTTTSATLLFTSGVTTSTFTVGGRVGVRRGSGTIYYGTVSSWSVSGSTYTLVVSFSSFSSSGSGTWNVGIYGQTYYSYKGSQPAMSWTYSNGSSVDTGTTFYTECNTTASVSGNSVFTAVTVTDTSAEATNYANWYSYYRTRMLMMKTAVGNAFTGIDSKFRVGFTTISNTTLPLLNVADFDTTQKSSFYTKLYAASGSSTTPLRGALSRAGQYYAMKAPSQTTDPVQYSCQRNFTLLSTDGYWNTGSEITTGASQNYGPYKLNNTTTVGQQDGVGTEPPYFDGQTATTTPITGTMARPSSGSYPRTVTVTVTTSAAHGYSTGNSVSIVASTWAASNGFTNGNYTITVTSTTTFTFSASLTSRPSGTASITLSNTTTTISGGSSDSLADVAMYYYLTDLRDSSLSNCTGALGSSVCSNNVPTSTGSSNKADWQHMQTFTLGLGAGGSLTYRSDYATAKSGDYFSIGQGTKNWPVPAADYPTAIDDLWHTAVNGQGIYFSVQNATTLANSLKSALDKIRSVSGSSSAAATSTLQPVQGDNDAFVAQFESVTWVGDIKKYSIDPNTGATTLVSGWSAQTSVANTAPASRKIYYKASTTNTLRNFNVTNLTSDSYDSYFNNFCSKTSVTGVGNPSQCASLSTADTTSANTVENLVNYLRGDTTATYYRTRTAVLGDIVNASPVFVGKPSNAFVENNYATFKSNYSARAGVVYAAANDGMLHAFSQSTGEELWAYIPTPMLSKLYKLADNDYSNNHDYFVDGTPVSADAYFNGAWHTVLVGGYRSGGRGYYALDVTDPSSPSVLWEFTDTHLGLSFGNPIVTKRADGTWVAVFASGYNNNTNGGDGNGHLYVVKLSDGSLIQRFDTNTTAGVAVGSTTTPSGLAPINAWVEVDTENLAQRFYGADLLGNVWRFDLDSKVQPYGQALLLAKLADTSGTGQSVTTIPQLAEIQYNGTNYPVVYVATGRYLGTSDLSTTQQQSAYLFTDPLTATSYGDIRAAGVLVSKTSSSTAVDWSAKKGWYRDFPWTGGRANVNSVLAINSVTTAVNVPSSDVCALGGSSYLISTDLVTGGYTDTSMGSTLIVGLTALQLASTGEGGGSTVILSIDSKGSLTTTAGGSSTGSIVLRRTSWREID